MLKQIYSCEICRDEKRLSELIGLKFSGMTSFKFSSPKHTNGIHICRPCIKQIVTETKANPDFFNSNF